MVNTPIVYGLFDPITDELRYVGKTVNSIVARVTEHKSKANALIKRKASGNHRDNWVASLLRRGLEPNFSVLACCTSEEAALAAEIRMIALYTAAGFNLTNATSGGEGISGYKHTKETKEWLSLWNTARLTGKPSPKKGKKHSVPSALKGTTQSECLKATRSAAIKKWWASRPPEERKQSRELVEKRVAGMRRARTARTEKFKKG